MLRTKQQKFNSVWVYADSQEELATAFMRFQEHYESPNEDFRCKIFTVGQLRNWYSIKYGADTYHKDWCGFNIPSSVLIPFKNGLFDPLTHEESSLLDLFRYRNDNFYIIGAQNKNVLRHELSHALYADNKKYSLAVNKLCIRFKKPLSKIKQYIKNKGYNESVLNDEIQAYITDNDDEFIIENLSHRIIDAFNKLYSIHAK